MCYAAMPGGNGSVPVIIRILVFLNLCFFTVLIYCTFVPCFLYGMFAEIKDTHRHKSSAPGREQPVTPIAGARRNGVGGLGARQQAQIGVQ